MLTPSAAASEMVISASFLLTVQLLCVMDTYMVQDDALWPEHARGAGVTCSDPWECCSSLSPAGPPHSLEGFVQLGSGCLKTNDTQQTGKCILFCENKKNQQNPNKPLRGLFLLQLF